MRLLIMAVALGLACAGCQTMGANVRGSDSTSAMVQLTADKATEHGVPHPLALAVVKVESNFDARANSQGNIGLGQIKCGTAKGIGYTGTCKGLQEPSVNLTYSMKYLRMALDAANDDWCKASTLYNQGLNSKGRGGSYCRKVLRNIPEEDRPLTKVASKEQPKH